MSLVAKIKAIFETQKEELASAENFTDVKAKDGSIVRIEGELKEGAKISTISEDGSVSEYISKEITLEDGTVISTDEKSTIIKIVAPEPVKAADEEEEDAPAEPIVEAAEVEAPTADKTAELESKVAELESAITILAEQIKSIMDGGESAVAEEMNEVKKENKSLKKQVKELSAEPAAPATNFKKVEAKDAVKKETKTNASPMLEKIIAMREEVENTKKK